MWDMLPGIGSPPDSGVLAGSGFAETPPGPDIPSRLGYRQSGMTYVSVGPCPTAHGRHTGSSHYIKTSMYSPTRRENQQSSNGQRPLASSNQALRVPFVSVENPHFDPSSRFSLRFQHCKVSPKHYRCYSTDNAEKPGVG